MPLVPKPPNIDLYEAAQRLELTKALAESIAERARRGAIENGSVEIAHLAEAIASLCRAIEPLLRDHTEVRLLMREYDRKHPGAM